jgi:hypothetical protein
VSSRGESPSMKPSAVLSAGKPVMLLLIFLFIIAIVLDAVE